MIKYPTDNRLESMFTCALSHPTFLDGLNWLVQREHERAYEARQSGSLDTCFAYLTREFIKRWDAEGKSIDLINEVK